MFKKVKVENGIVTESSFVEGYNKQELQVIVSKMGVLTDSMGSKRETKRGADWREFKIPDGEYLLSFRRFGVMKATEFFTDCKLYAIPTVA